MLPSEGDSNDRDTQQHSKKQVSQGNPYPADKKPDHVHQCGQTSFVFENRYGLLPERNQGKHSQFKGLQAEWDTNNGQTEQNPGNYIFQGDNQPSENDPDDVPQ
jgi:hypothetical protein